MVPTPAPRKAKSLVKSIFGSFGSSSHSSNNEPTSNSVTSPKAQRKAAKEKETSVVPSATINTPSTLSEIKPTVEANEDETRTLQHLNKNRAKRANVKRPTVKHPVSSIVTIAEDDYMNDSTTAPAQVHVNGTSEALTTSVINGIQSNHISTNGGASISDVDISSLTPSITVSTS